MNKRPMIAGFLAAIALFTLFIVLVSALSGWNAARDQMVRYWYFLGPLAAGFGIQIGLFVHLRETVRRAASKKLVAATGATSTVAMISCCAHYLANILPFIGVAGLSAIVGRYQVPVFWVGLAANAVGIGILVRRVRQVGRLPHAVHPTGHEAVPDRPFINHAVVAIAFIMVVATMWWTTRPNAVMPVVSSMSAAPNAAGRTKTNTDGDMTVAVTPERRADGLWEFRVAIDNHTVDVTQDMVAVSSLTDAAGRVIRPTEWTGDPPGGHHRSGSLRFPSVPTSTVTLTIRDLGGVPQRLFTWDNLSS